MATDDKFQQTIEDRIKAYIYFGVEAEMEIIDLQSQLKNDSDEEDWKEHLRQKIIVAQEKIALANKRIDQLENPPRRL